MEVGDKNVRFSLAWVTVEPEDTCKDLISHLFISRCHRNNLIASIISVPHSQRDIHHSDPSNWRQKKIVFEIPFFFFRINSDNPVELENPISCSCSIQSFFVPANSAGTNQTHSRGLSAANDFFCSPGARRSHSWERLKNTHPTANSFHSKKPFVRSLLLNFLLNKWNKCARVCTKCETRRRLCAKKYFYLSN